MRNKSRLLLDAIQLPSFMPPISEMNDMAITLMLGSGVGIASIVARRLAMTKCQSKLINKTEALYFRQLHKAVQIVAPKLRALDKSRRFCHQTKTSKKFRQGLDTARSVK